MNAASGRALTDHDVELKIFHRRVQVFLGDAPEAVNLVNEQHVAFLQRIGEDCCQVAGFLNRGPRGDFDPHAEFIGDDVRQRRLAQSGRPKQQGVIQCLSALPRSRNVDLELTF